MDMTRPVYFFYDSFDKTRNDFRFTICDLSEPKPMYFHYNHDNISDTAKLLNLFTNQSKPRVAIAPTEKRKTREVPSDLLGKVLSEMKRSQEKDPIARLE